MKLLTIIQSFNHVYLRLDRLSTEGFGISVFFLMAVLVEGRIPGDEILLLISNLDLGMGGGEVERRGGGRFGGGGGGGRIEGSLYFSMLCVLAMELR